MEKTIEKDLEIRILDHISRGNKKAFSIIATYHMDEIIEIRNHMLSTLNDHFYDARQLNQSFHKAVADLKINLVDLLEPEVKVVTCKPAMKRAM